MCKETSTAVHLGQIELEEEIPLDEEQMPNNRDEVVFVQEEKLMPLHNQEPEYAEEDQWNLYDEKEYYVPEEELSPYDL